jgi:rhamnulokinase
MKRYLAVDLGAESGRVMAASLHDSTLELEQLHRFANTPVRLPTGLYWDTLRLWHEIQEGLHVAGRKGYEVLGIGVDTWGVDFGLLGADGALVDNPRHYRDARNNGMIEATAAALTKEKIYSETGLQFMQFNTLCQLHALKLAGSPALGSARSLVFMPDLFAYFLSGAIRAEQTIASTSQFYNPATGKWAMGLLSELGIPGDILPEIVPAGTRLGTLRAEVAEAAGLSAATPVFAAAGHDTAAAVAAVPADRPFAEGGWCYISSGTWSLMGVELDAPITTARALELNFTNEVGVEGKVRLLKNIMGLWPLQECRRAWESGGRAYSYAELAELAAAAQPFAAVIDPDAFLEPGHMPERIAQWAGEHGEAAPADAGTFARVILESLALRYRQVLESLEALTGRAISTVHIVGGGSQNALLNQMVADCTQRTVVAGPTEATAAGNVLVQAMGAGEMGGLGDIRAVVRRSFPLQTITPRPGAAEAGWNAAYERFRKLQRAV